MGDLTPARTLTHRFYSSTALPSPLPDDRREPVEHFLLGRDANENPTNLFLIYIGKRFVGFIGVPAKQKVFNWALAIANMVDVAIG